MILFLFLIFVLLLSLVLIFAVLCCIINSPFESESVAERYKIRHMIHELPKLNFDRQFSEAHPPFSEGSISCSEADTSIPKMLKAHVANDLMDMLHILTEAMHGSDGMEIWALDHTLLGVVRHGGIIPWVSSLSFGFRHDDLTKLVSYRPELERTGKYILQKKKTEYVFSRNNFCRFPFITLQSFNIREDEVSLCAPLDELLNCTYEESFVRRRGIFAVEDVFPLITLPFEDLHVRVPADYNKCLVQLYGKNYQTEVRGIYPLQHLINNDVTRGLLRRFTGK